MGIANHSTPSQPLASVIVRTIGRDTLSRTIECIERQTWRPIEAVVVRAREVALPALDASIPMRIVGEGSLDRPRAANAGLQAARGEWILFLDEDDLIEPDHIETLVAAAQASKARVAYSQTRLVDAKGATQRIFGGPFHRELLKRSNYIAIHAALFHRSFVDEGVRFDESLATFEDWDFWLQLAQRGGFAFVPRPSAIYHAERGASGAGAGANLDRDALLRQRERLMRKWGLA
jgi:glycosyltransferase involved in cell wall biosynthesis